MSHDYCGNCPKCNETNLLQRTSTNSSPREQPTPTMTEVRSFTDVRSLRTCIVAGCNNRSFTVKCDKHQEDEEDVQELPFPCFNKECPNRVDKPKRYCEECYNRHKSEAVKRECIHFSKCGNMTDRSCGFCSSCTAEDKQKKFLLQQNRVPIRNNGIECANAGCKGFATNGKFHCFDCIAKYNAKKGQQSVAPQHQAVPQYQSFAPPPPPFQMLSNVPQCKNQAKFYCSKPPKKCGFCEDCVARDHAEKDKVLNLRPCNNAKTCGRVAVEGKFHCTECTAEFNAKHNLCPSCKTNMKSIDKNVCYRCFSSQPPQFVAPPAFPMPRLQSTAPQQEGKQCPVCEKVNGNPTLKGMCPECYEMAITIKVMKQMKK